MEQRKELRATLRVPATLISRHGGRQDVILSDFSDQGALVTLENAQLAGPQDQEIVILYVVPDRQQPDQVQDVRARVMYRRGDQIGLSFIEVPRSLLEALRREVLQPPQKIVSPAIQTLMQAMQQLALSFFEEHIKSFTATVLERLQAAQSTSRSDAESLQFKEAMNAFMQRQSTIQHRYMEYMHPVLTQFAAPGYSPEVQKQAQMRQLSLIDKDEFESWLVVKVMITKVEGAFREQLFALQLRLDDMLHAAAGKQFNPFAPLIACDALKYAFSAYVPGMTLERLLYRAFDETVLVHLGSLYQDLNQLMIRHGVLPELDLAKFMANGPSAQTAPRVSEGEPDKKESGGDQVQLGQVVENGSRESSRANHPVSSGPLSRAPHANLHALSEDL